jgi:hypothetical protein
MGGGINRHLSGLTRIKNAENFKELMGTDPYWKDRVEVPRKWFWLPSDTRWITIAGSNIGKYKHVSIDVPASYCIIADAIDIERRMTLVNKEDRIESMALCNKAKFTIDPHIDNFMIERSTQKIILVDTEDFHALVGFKHELDEYTSQFTWYRDLSLKCVNDMFCRDKSCRHP